MSRTLLAGYYTFGGRHRDQTLPVILFDRIYNSDEESGQSLFVKIPTYTLRPQDYLLGRSSTNELVYTQAPAHVLSIPSSK